MFESHSARDLVLIAIQMSSLRHLRSLLSLPSPNVDDKCEFHGL